MGEDDQAAKAGDDVKSTTDRSPIKRDLKVVGKPKYTSEVSAADTASKMCVEFDGATSALRRDGLDTLQDNFVVEVFARAQTDQGFHVVVQYGSGAYGWSIVRNNKGFQVLLGGIALIGWSGDIASGEWVHLAIVRDGGVTRFFVNGKPSGEGNQPLNEADAKAPLSVGSNTEGKEWFKGQIDDLRIYRFAAGTFDPALLLVNDPQGKAIDKAAALPAGPAGDASILFSATPVTKGMTFKQTAMTAETVAADNGSREAWVVHQGSAQDVPWARSLFITLTDPRLRDGQQPVVDIEVEYKQTFDAPVELRADTESGSRKVGDGWGRNNAFQKFRVRLDDAYFGARSFGHKTTDMATDGYDLRINSFAQDFAIRSIKLVAYDLRDDPDFKRLVVFDGVKTANDLLIFAPGSQQTIDYQFHNLAFKEAALVYHHQVTDVAQHVVSESTDQFVLNGRSKGLITIPVDTKTLPRGPYRTHLVVTDSKQQTILDRTGGFIVADDSPVAAGGSGSFLYGLDIKLGASYDSPRLLRWAQWMGANIIRHGFGDASVEEIAAHLPAFEQHGLQVLLMCDPPKDQEHRADQLPAKLDYLRTVAKRFRQIRFFELGNEPDLTFFYPGPIENYASDFLDMSDAIHESNPSALVMNGGLCFAGNDAATRARRFIEVADPKRFGAWAYHGHGPGEKAEADAYTRTSDLIRAAGKELPMAETETGVAAQTPQQEIVQARTVVQKMVYAQSKHEPFLIFFRLFMFEEPYGMLYSEVEPRPSVAAYATMTRMLHGLQYRSQVAGLPPGVRGYVFSDDTGDGRRAAVFWGDSAQAQRIDLTLKQAPSSLQTVDLYGNARSATADHGVITVDVGADPTYLTWSQTPAEQLALVPPILQIPSELVVRTTGVDSASVAIVSDGRPIQGTLHVKAGAHSGVKLIQSDFPVNIPAGERQIFAVPLELSSSTSLQWPSQWTCFVDLDDAQVDLSKLSAIPASLPGAGGAQRAAQQALLLNDKLDFEQLGGRMREKACAVAMGVVVSDVDQDVTVGASADWWMQWFVNGKAAFSTIENGNGGGYSVSDHTFKVHLQKGNNLIAVRELSGSMGWKLLIGSPERLAQLTTDVKDSGIQFDLSDPSRSNQQVTVALKRMPDVAAWALPGRWSATADWEHAQPDFILLDHITNQFAAQPDSSKWWKGAADLSARGWLRSNGEHLMLVLAVTDDQFMPSPGGAEAGDALRLQFADAKGAITQLDVVPTSPTQATVVAPPDLAVSADVRREGTTTLYQVDLACKSRADWPGALNVTVFDQDAVPAKQNVTLCPTTALAAPAGWYRIIRP